MRWVLALMVMVRVVHADPAADVTKAFQGFVERAGVSEPGLELFIPPGDDGPAQNDFVWPPVPPDATYATDYLKTPKVSIQKLVVSPSGSSAWLAGEIRNAKPRPTLRASALLVKDDKGWHVRATHWSLPKKDDDLSGGDIGCGALSYEWHIKPGTPAPLRATVVEIVNAFGGTLGSVLSDDKNAHLFGSAPGETFTGGAAIKNVFKTWKVTGPWHEPGKDLSARAGLVPGGDLAWMVLEIGGAPEQCTDFRTFFVLAREDSGWKLVHQHYSLPAK
jgi:ketosteroid isomerase-like protein